MNFDNGGGGGGGCLCLLAHQGCNAGILVKSIGD